MSMEGNTGIFVAAIVAAALLQGCTQKVEPTVVAGNTTRADRSRAVREAQENFDRVYAINKSEAVEAWISARSHDPRNASSPAANNADARRQRVEARQRVAAARLALDIAEGKDGQSHAIGQCNVNGNQAAGSCIAGATSP